MLNQLNSAKALLVDNFKPYLAAELVDLPEGVSDDAISDSYFAITSKCVTLQAKLETYLHGVPRTVPPPLDQSTQLDASLRNDPNSSSNLAVCLPKFRLPVFEGDISNFEHFWSRFDTLINKSTTLSTLEKFEYLLGSLKGPALDIVKHLAFSEVNYQTAIDLTKNRFANPRRAVSLHANQMLNLPKVGNSVVSIRTYLDQFNVHYNAIKNATKSQPADVIFVQFLLSKFSSELRDKFESSLVADSFPANAELITFLSKQVTILENASANDPLPSSVPHSFPKSRSLGIRSDKRQTKSSYSALATQIKQADCLLGCKSNHPIIKCDLFLRQTPRQRHDLLKRRSICIICLSHHDGRCTVVSKCSFCHSAYHNSLLHFGKAKAVSQQPVAAPNSSPGPNKDIQKPSTSDSSDQPVSSCMTVQGVSSSSVLLATALIRVQVSNNKFLIIRSILDSASNVSFISERVAQQLNCSRVHKPVTVVGVADCSTSAKSICSLDVASIDGTILSKGHSFVIMPSVTSNTPKCLISEEVQQAAHNLVLADPTFHIPSRIDALIGSDVTAASLLGGVVHLGNGFPVAISTRFGYVLFGRAPASLTCHMTCASSLSVMPTDSLSEYQLHCDVHNSSVQNSTVNSYVTSVDNDSLSDLVQKFWSSEELPSHGNFTSVDDMYVEQFYCDTTTRDSSGRYQVRLPFKPEDVCSLSNNYHIALRRMRALERKFHSDPAFKALYVDCIKDYISQGHMVPINDPTYPKFFIPHHAVFRRHGDKSKLRVVYDGSCHDISEKSLNSVLFSGPKLQPFISDILTLFRYFNTVFTCDIEQMYRQINIHPADQPYQCILWRESPSDPIQMFSLTRVTFGLASSPYHAIRTLKQLASDAGSQFPRASAALCTTTFVDDIVAGGCNVSEAILVKQEIVSLLAQGCFVLKKWFSNNPLLLNPSGNEVNLSKSVLPVSTSILGINWNLLNDMLSYPPSDFTLPSSKVMTKRAGLAQVASLYDPCGWIAPVVMRGKCLMQDAWKSKVDWDTPLPTLLNRRWCTFLSQLIHLSKISIPRLFLCEFSHLSHPRVQVHGFSDAAQRSYAACLYIRSVDSPFQCNLVASKTRIAPLSPVSIPRLELMGACLLAELVHHYVSVLSSVFNLESIWLWSDSSIVLHWINTDPSLLKVFVANRVVKILELSTTSQWYHVPGCDNPADIASRGCSPLELSRSELWWSGPPWLNNSSSHWPLVNPVGEPPPSFHLELRQGEVTACATTISNDLFDRISSWPLLIRVAAMVAKWVLIVKHLPLAPLTLSELGHLYLMRYIQASSFKAEMALLSAGKRVSLSMQRLVPFIDQDGLLRARGRLNFATCVPNKFPIILPKRHPLVNLLIYHTHVKLHHAGPSQVQYQLSLSYWILAARQIIRSVLFKCVVCFRAKPRLNPPLMADLPADRVNPAPPFSIVGIDYCGPFTVKASHLRKAPLIKTYLCIFICMTTKAIHLELCSDLSTAGFIDCLKRFISRRGCPKKIYCDCGTAFVGADRQLKLNLTSLLASNDASHLLQSFASENHIEFNFSSPLSPEKGGLWERAVQSAKYHLRRVVGLNIYTFAQFTSIVINVEGILNSRPITVLSSQPGDLEVLTPGHFLIGRAITCPPEDSITIPGTNRLQHYQSYRSLLQHFWSKWKLEYLSTLHSRSKWYKASPNLEIDDVVVVEDPQDPPLYWPLGRITKIFPASDGVVRKAEVVTSAGAYVRPAVRLYRIPVSDRDCD